MTKRTRLTDAERDERRAQQRALAIASVEQLRSSEGWRGYLKARRTLRTDYSARNILLIVSQRPTATRVAGFRAWLDLGYCVQKRPADVAEGRWAIRIWARCEPSRKRLDAWQQAGGIAEDRPRPLYKLVNVFAQDQVQALPPPATPVPLEPPAVLPIAGDSHARLLAELAGLADAIGYTFEIGPLGDGVDGICRPQRRQITIGDHLSPNGQVAASVHELAHALVKADDLAPELSYAEEELVVESVAWCCCQTVGLGTDENSIPYLAGWAQEASLEVLQRDAELCDRVARRIEDALASSLSAEPCGQRVAPAGHPAAWSVATSAGSQPAGQQLVDAA